MTLPAERKPWLLEGAALLLMLLAMMLAGDVQASSATSLAELMGAFFAPPILTLIVVGVARLLGRARSRRGAAQAALVTLSVCVLGSLGNLGSRAARRDKGPEPLTSAQLAAIADEASKQLPKKVDAETELVGISASGTTLVYTYRIITTLARELDPKGVVELRSAIVRHDCVTPATRGILLQRGVTTKHVFVDREKTVAMTIEIRDADCPQPQGVAAGSPPTAPSR